mmetsp:Transcript_100323/g.189258  ORF Transcript_100323/g.189258 Transcript_100323/m.189258 type:complete len:641 (-) Transcript_100323:180-2102(-)
MFALPVEEDAVLHQVLPGVRPPPGKAAGRLVADCLPSMEADPRLLPRLPQGGRTARGPTPPPALPVPSAPLGPLVRPGKTIESVLRAMPSAGGGGAAALCGTKGHRTWPSVDSPGAASEPSPRRERRRREASHEHSHNISARGEAAVDNDKVTFSPRPPVDGRPHGTRKLGGRRASSEGPQQHGMPLSPAASTEKSSSRSKRTPRDRPESLDTKARVPVAPNSSRGAEARRSNRPPGVEESGGHRKSGAPPEAHPSPRRSRPRSVHRTPSPSLEAQEPRAEQEAPPLATALSSASEQVPGQDVPARVAQPRPVRSARVEAADWFNLFLQEAEAEANTAFAARVAPEQTESANGSQSYSSRGRQAVPGPQERRDSRPSSADSSASLEHCRAGTEQALPGPLPRVYDSRPSSAGSSAPAATAEETGIVGTRPMMASSREESDIVGALNSLADAARAQSASVALNPLILEEMDSEREMWEARTKQLLMCKPTSSGGEALQRQEPAGIAASSEADAPAVASETLPNRTRVASTERPARHPGEAEQMSDEDGLIAAALKAAGLRPGLEARTALIQGGQEARGAPTLQVVSEAQEDDESATNGLAVGPTDGSARWAMSAREWAQQRLRRKRERVGGSRPGTPCNGI